jgi:hypothetical protein
MSKSKVLDDAVRGVLCRAIVAGDLVTLPGERLDRKVYVAVNDALEALGGKWDRKRGGHAFRSDPSPLVAALLDSGNVPETNPLAYWPTPGSVIQQMLAFADVGGLSVGATVLEPSAGEGAIVAALRQACPSIRIIAVEMDPERANTLSRRDIATEVWGSDFLDWPDGEESRFDRVLMNPPFSVARNKSEWIDHVRLAYDRLAPGGILVAVVPSSVEHRVDKRHAAFRDWCEERNGVTHSLASGSFTESGTGVNTALLSLSRPASGSSRRQRGEAE